MQYKQGGAMEMLGDLTIDLEGANSIEFTDTVARDKMTVINAKNITVTGSAGSTLDVSIDAAAAGKNRNLGISTGTLTVKDACTLKATTPPCTELTDVLSAGCTVSNLVVDNGSVDSTGAVCGIDVAYGIEAKNGARVDASGAFGLRLADNTTDNACKLTTSGTGGNELAFSGIQFGLSATDSAQGLDIEAAPYQDKVTFAGDAAALGNPGTAPLRIVKKSNTMNAFPNADGTGAELPLVENTSYSHDNLGGYKNLRIENDGAPADHAVKVTAPDATVEVTGTLEQTVPDGTPIDAIAVKAAEGYYLPADYLAEDLGHGLYAAKTTTPVAGGGQVHEFTITGTPWEDATISLKSATQAVKRDTPVVTFAADGPDSGDFDTYGFEYSVDGGATWNQLANSTHITGVGVDNGIDVKTSGDGVETLDSDIRHIAITKPDAPAVEATANGFESAVSELQYSSDDGATWIDADPIIGQGSRKDGLAAGTYSVCVKPNGRRLASDPTTIVVTIPTHTVKIAAADGSGIALEGAQEQAVTAGGAMTPVTVKAAAGYYLPADYSPADPGHGLSVEKKMLTNGRGTQYYEFVISGTPTEDADVSVLGATQAAKLDAAFANFTATGTDTGIFDTPGLECSTDGGATWAPVAGDLSIAGVSAARGVDIRLLGDGVATLDSDARHIAVTQADAPAVEATNDGFTSAAIDLQYSADGTTWTDCPVAADGRSVATGLAAGTYSVRVKPASTQLASASVSVTVAAAPDPEPGPDPTPAPEPVVIAGVDMATAPKLATTASKIAKANTDKADPAGSTFLPLQLSATGGAKKVTVKWAKIAGVSGYAIYGAKCGKKMKKLATVSKSKTKWVHKGLKKGTYYKYVVIAYAKVDGVDKTVKTSTSVHAATNGGKKGNPAQVTAKKSKLTVKKGKAVKLNASVKSTKKYTVHIAKLRYESADASIAKVNKKGKVTGKKKGKVKVYAYAQNGKRKAVTVTVK